MVRIGKWNYVESKIMDRYSDRAAIPAAGRPNDVIFKTSVNEYM